MQQIEPRPAGPPVSILAINDALSAPFDAEDLEYALGSSTLPLHAGAKFRAEIVPSLGVCPECGDEVCAHRPQMLHRAQAALAGLAVRQAAVVVAAAGSSAPVALLLAAMQPRLVRAIVLVRPRLGIGAPRESVFARLMRRLAWPCCVLIGAEPPQRADPTPELGVSLAELGPRLRTISQPTLIVHARGRRCDAFDDSWLLQRELAGMVEMVTIPDIESSRSYLGELGLARLQSFVSRVSVLPPPAEPPPVVVPGSAPPRGVGVRQWAFGRP